MNESERARPIFGDRFYFAATSIFMALVVMAAFAPSFYLRQLLHGRVPTPFPAPTPLIAFHATLMTGWILLLVIQALLVSLRRTGWHRTLGYAGFCYAALIVPTGCLATLAAAVREVHAHSNFVRFQLNVLGLELMQMALFGGFIAASIFLRAQPDRHKRLILLATLCLLPNAIVRLSFIRPFDFLSSNFAILNTWILLLLCIVAIDAFRIRRLHPVYLYGVPTAVCALHFALAASRTDAWDRFWLASLS